jgi:hypothetical protein
MYGLHGFAGLGCGEAACDSCAKAKVGAGPACAKAKTTDSGLGLIWPWDPEWHWFQSSESAIAASGLAPSDFASAPPAIDTGLVPAGNDLFSSLGISGGSHSAADILVYGFAAFTLWKLASGFFGAKVQRAQRRRKRVSEAQKELKRAKSLPLF